ncbi:AAA family ATPase [Hymenobacter guriensis]|uniref:AAA family ATPase n=1 Tax=Hymenobacter guriensis TaxID=2793065 RepID=A0ABS0L3G4_9BACT|nr:AAA family ATPase [Hymenobacter guriensis]MBG8554664.1 AAA family ATPase [Hymenobacter guriensis]
MQNDIKTLRIQNFKSIKDVTMTPRRVNLIIGPPNVGKSNILEAMSLLGAGLYDDRKTFMGEVLRYECFSNLFYDNDNSIPVVVESSKYITVISSYGISRENYKVTGVDKNLFNEYKNIVQKDMLDYRVDYNVEKEDVSKLVTEMDSERANGQDAISNVKREGYIYDFHAFSVQESGSFNRLNGSYYIGSPLLSRYYVFKHKQPYEQRSEYKFLSPPYGANLLEIVKRNKVLRKDIVTLFKPYGLNLVLRVNDRKFEIQKNIDDFVYNYPYSSIADTLQRIIFYLAAIESNDDAVILFEEPEAHSYPQYVSMLGKRIAQSRNNQFFVATHSPYLLTEILEQMLPDEEQARELAIFVTYYEDYQTKVKQLSDEEVRAIRGDSVDVFYNMNRYIPRPANG